MHDWKQLWPKLSPMNQLKKYESKSIADEAPLGCHPDPLEGASPLKLERRGCLAISATHDFQCKIM